MTTKASKTSKKTVIDDSKVLTATSPVDECMSLIAQAKTAFGATAPSLTKLDRRHALKPRTGSPTVIATIGRLAKAQGIVLPKHSVDTMLQNVQTVQTLAPLKAAILALHKIVDDTMLSSNGQAWDSATALYTVLRRVQGNDGGLEADLDPVAAFFKKGHAPAKKKAAVAKPTATTSTSPATTGSGGAVTAAPAAAPAASSESSVTSSGAPVGASATHA